MAAHAAPYGDPENPSLAAGMSSRSSSPISPDPLRRLEAELGSADSGRADDDRLYVEAQGLVEEAWSLVTECLVLRDGLLDACQEIEQTMDGIQQRLAGLPFAFETDRPARPASSERFAVSSDGPPINGAATI